MDLSQSGCQVSFNNLDSHLGFHHTVQGHWDPVRSDFSLNVARLDPRKCWTHLYVRATVQGPSVLGFNITSTEGRCGLPSTFTDNYAFNRQ